MALRIAGNQPPPPVEDVPVDPASEMVEQADTVSDQAMMPIEDTGTAGLVSPEVVRYMTSDRGPFICANCLHFQDDGSCEIVSGPIDPEGVCILFESPQNDLEGVAEDVVPAEAEEVLEAPETETE